MIDEYKEQLFEIITRRLIDNEMRSLSSEFMRYVAGGIIKYSELNLKYVEYQRFSFFLIVPWKATHNYIWRENFR